MNKYDAIHDPHIWRLKESIDNWPPLPGLTLALGHHPLLQGTISRLHGGEEPFVLQVLNLVVGQGACKEGIHGISKEHKRGREKN